MTTCVYVRWSCGWVGVLTTESPVIIVMVSYEQTQKGPSLATRGRKCATSNYKKL